MCQLNPKLIVVEATGGYEEALVLSLFEAGMPVALVSPQRVRQYAKARGLLAKTDKLDAQNSAEYGKNIQPRLFVAKNEEGRRLSAIMGRRRQLADMQKAEKKPPAHGIFGNASFNSNGDRPFRFRDAQDHERA